MRKELSILAKAALASSQLQPFHDALATQMLPDSFGILADSELIEMLRAKLGGEVGEWITRPLTWDADAYDPLVAPKFGPEDQLLHLLWQDLDTRLAQKIAAVARKAALASKGAVLCFFGRAALTIIVEYTRSGGGAVNLRPLAAVPEPAGVFELDRLFDRQPPQIRNSLKKSALSVDKIVFQRGTIIHVDRQREDVFGPTIDTVILGELIAEFLEARTGPKKISAMEIGCGSGLLTALLATSDRVGELTALDLNEAAVICTLKNLQINGISLDTSTQNVRIRGERFTSAQFTDRYDLIVCNPPYIPNPPDETPTPMKEYGRAVGGVELGIEILQALPTLLAENGVLLLMTSSVSDRDVLSLPEGFESQLALASEGRRVPLDVDLLWQRQDWRDRLLADGKIEQDDEGELWHYLRPVWVRRPAPKH